MASERVVRRVVGDDTPVGPGPSPTPVTQTQQGWLSLLIPIAIVLAIIITPLLIYRKKYTQALYVSAVPTVLGLLGIVLGVLHFNIISGV